MMRKASVGLAVLLSWFAAGAGAQTAWLGATAGASWQDASASDPDASWPRSDGLLTSLFAAVPLDDSTAVRLTVANVPYEALYSGADWPGRFRAYTLGVDYFLKGGFGQAVFSAGAGQYGFDAQAQHPPEEMESREFGWYVGVGEWLQLGRRARALIEVQWHQPNVVGKPSLLTASAGVAVSF